MQLLFLHIIELFNTKLGLNMQLLFLHVIELIKKSIHNFFNANLKAKRKISIATDRMGASSCRWNKLNNTIHYPCTFHMKHVIWVQGLKVLVKNGGKVQEEGH